jgi:hypothetical protein
MRWRRGLLLAGIHLAVALPMIWIMEARDQKAMRDEDENSAEAAREAAAKPPEPVKPVPAPASSEQGEETVTFSPNSCGMWVDYPLQVVVVQGADMPALALAGWEMDCPPGWSIAGRLRGNMKWPPTPSWMATQRRIDEGLGFLIALQWFLIGAFPLVRIPSWRKWWGEPGTFITLCAVLAGLLALFPAVEGAARPPALLGMLAWYWWFGLLVWTLIRGAWRVVVRRLVAAG